MPDILHCAVELEPEEFHENRTGLSARLAFEPPLCELGSEKCELDARTALHGFLDQLKDVRFFRYRLGEWGNPPKPALVDPVKLERVQFASDNAGRFKSWLDDLKDKKNKDSKSPDPFFSVRTEEMDEDVSARRVGAVHVLMGAGTWPAPIPQGLGLTNVLRTEEAFHAEHHYVVIPLFIDERPDFFLLDEPPSKEQVAGKLPIEFTIEQGGSGQTIRRCRTNFIVRAAADASSLVDPKNGFLYSDDNARALYAAAERLKRHAGGALWTFHALQNLKLIDGPPLTEDQLFRELVWRCVSSLASSLDLILISLFMPKPDVEAGKPPAAEVEGPLLAPLIDLLAEPRDDEPMPEPEPEPEDHLRAIREALNKLDILSDDRQRYAKALARALGLAVPLEPKLADSQTPLIDFLLSVFANVDPEKLDDVAAAFEAFKVFVLGLEKELGRSPSEVEIVAAASRRLETELFGIGDIANGETGVEDTVLRIFHTLNFDQAYAGALDPERKKEWAEAFREAREELARFFAGPFNGAEAARQGAATQIVRLLMNEKAANVGELRKRLEDSNFFYSRLCDPKDCELTPILSILRPPAAAWFDLAWHGENPEESGNLHFEFKQVVEDLFPDAAKKKRFVPLTSPPNIPVLISVDHDTNNLDEFNKSYNGLAILARRREKTEAQDEPWAYVNLSDLMEPSPDPNPPVIAANAIAPMQTVETDGRRELAFEHSGAGFSTRVFDKVGPEGVEVDIERRGYFEPGDAAYKESDYSRIYALAYGTQLDLACHVVSKGGVLPKPIQTSDGNPCLPKSSPSNIPDKAIQRHFYSRQTAIGRTTLTEPPRNNRIGARIAVVQPLSTDYPRLTLSAPGFARSGVVTDVFVDVFRDGAGNGTINLPDKDGEITLDLAELWAWRGGGTLTVEALQDPRTKPEEKQAPLIELRIPEGRHAWLRVTFTRKTEGEHPRLSFAMRLKDGEPSAAADFDDLKTSPWLRLRIKEQGDASLSFAEPAADLPKANVATDDPFVGAGRALIPHVLVAENSALWRENFREAVSARIGFPRVGYEDFDRWLNNGRLYRAAGMDLSANPANPDFVSQLFAAFMRRSEIDPHDEVPLRIAKLVDRLPDPAVDGLLLSLEPVDGLRDAPGDLVKKVNRQRDLPLMFPSLGERVKAAGWKTGMPLEDCRTVLRALDLQSAVDLSIHCTEGDELGLDKEQQGEQPAEVKISVPAGLCARFTARPLVAQAHFKKFEDGELQEPAPVIDERMQELVCGEFTDENGKEYFVFEGAALTIEGMLGPIAVEPKDELQGRPWQMKVKTKYDETTPEPVNGWAALVSRLLKSSSAGGARRYDVEVKPDESVADLWKWRQVGSVDVYTQRWRHTGRPIYKWFSPERSNEGGSSLKVDGAPAGFDAFEQQAFFDRDDLDADLRTSRLDPLPAASKVLTVDWEKPSAMMFRHRIAVRSRYAGAMARPADGVAQAWTEENPWLLRVVMLAERSRLQLTRPQLRALIPLTASPGERASPPVLAIVQERPFAHGGLADRVAAGVRTSLGYELDEEKLSLTDARKEAGPDPQLSYGAFDEEKANRIVLRTEGPMGLTFDVDNAPAPAFPNSAYLLQPQLATGDRAPSLQEHFFSVALIRFLDPHWLVREADKAPVASETWWIECELNSEHEATLKVGSFELCQMTSGHDAPFLAKFNRRAVDHGSDNGFLPLCLAPWPKTNKAYILYAPLENGRISLSIFVDLDESGASAEGDAPTFLASIEMDPSNGVDGTPLASQLLTLTNWKSKFLPTSASPSTPLNWVRTNKDFDQVHATTDKEPRFIPVTEFRALPNNGNISFRTNFGKAWIHPSEWTRKYPLNVQRHYAVLFTKWSVGPGKGKEEAVPELRRLLGLEAPKPVQADHVRLLEFETRSAICGNKAMAPKEYKTAIFDLKSIGVAAKEAQRLRFFARIIAGDSFHNAQNRSIELHWKCGEQQAGSWRISIANNQKRAVGIYFSLLFGQKAKAAETKILYADGELDNLGGNAAEIDLTHPEPGPDDLKLEVSAGNHEIWLETSMLATTKGDADSFDFDWLFGSSGDLSPSGAALSENLSRMNESQARLIAVSPPIRLE